jgi:O-antigen/teichoic acid export membrane protein
MAIFRGFQRFDLVNLISIAGTLLSAGLTVGMLLGGGGVIGIMLAHLLTSLLMQAPTLWLIRRVAPELRIDLRRASRNRVQAVTAFSASLFVINLAGHLQSKTDEIVIARFLPLSMVAPYALARRFSEAAHILTQQFIKVLLPLASELHANHEDARLRSTYIVSTRLALVTFLPVGCTLLMLSRPLLTLWVGAAYAETNYLVLVLTIAGLIDISQWPAVSILTGMARHQPLAAIAIGSGLTNLALSLVLVQYLGILGVALGTLIPVAIECLGFVLPYALRIIDVRMSELLRAVMWPAMAPALPMIATLYLLQDTFAPTSLFSLATIAAVGLLVYGLGYLIIGASPTERKLYRTLLANGLGVAQVRFQNLMR